MHTSAGAACGRDDDGGDAPELYVCRSFLVSKIKELVEPVNERIREPELRPLPATSESTIKIRLASET